MSHLQRGFILHHLCYKDIDQAMFSEAINHKQFPDFFTNKGSIQNNVLPLKMNGHTYWMSSLLTDNNSTLQRPYQKPYEDNEEGSLDCCDAEENYDIHLTKSVPKPNESGEVKITGDTERNVASGRTQLTMIVMQQKDKLPISHFVSIPVTSEGVKEKLLLFQKEVLKLNLRDRNKQYKLNIRGLEIMNDDPSEVNVLYCNVDTDDQDMKLQEIVDKISEHYYKAGLARKQYDRRF
ncbi:hypothetical protein NQ318_006465 [Aromia moschata]|uniref:A-kinase anchor protein 7-like phosphoesterase domain-containing protein n=1 Tax=Aromia moschata TaxID=1265417 RepID=A0AAV8X9K5_9CUCU|nr:hypothetical protein NQ318_006465 [Aromia moschata]